MQYKRRMLIGGIALATIAAGVGILGGMRSSQAQGPTPRQPRIGEKAPAFTVKTLKGETMDPTAQRGKVVLIDFWATWCPPCRASIPYLQSLQDKYGSQGLMVVGVSPEERDDVAPFAEKNKMTYTLSAGPENAKVLSRYGVEGIPTMVIVDRQGKVRLYEVGFNAAAVAKVVKTTLAEKAK